MSEQHESDQFDKPPEQSAPRRSLSSRAVRGASWIVVGKIIARSLTLLNMIILARLLDPRDFGLFGIVMIAVATMETFSKTGFSVALIQQKHDVEKYLDTAWTVQALRSVILSLLLTSIAPALASFFSEPRVIHMARVIAVSVLLNGLINVGILYFQKELEFHKDFIFNTVSSITSFIVGVYMAYRYRSVWALVYAELAGAIFRVIVSYMLHPYRPSIRLDMAKAKEMFGYGKWVFACSITIYCGSKMDDLMVGKMLDTTALGIYLYGYTISLLPIQEVTYTIHNVAFPSYAKMQGDHDRTMSAFNRLFQLSTFLSIPACVGMALIAPAFVEIVLGQKWLSVVPPLQILLMAQLIKSINSTGSPLFMGVGLPQYEFYMQFARTIALAFLLYPLIKWLGLAGASWAVVGSAIVMFACFYYSIEKLTGLDIYAMGNRLIPPTVGTLLMALFVYKALQIFDFEGVHEIIGGLKLAAVIIPGIIVYFVVAIYISKKLHYDYVVADLKMLARPIASRIPYIQNFYTNKEQT
jgi:lipopolysaccharide exporter